MTYTEDKFKERKKRKKELYLKKAGNLPSIGLSERAIKVDKTITIYNSIAIVGIVLMAVVIYLLYKKIIPLKLTGIIFIIVGVILGIIGFLLARYVINPFRNQQYYFCPYDDCGKSVYVKEDWQCNHCDQHQEVERFLHLVCAKCRIAYLETAYCEHCKKEFII